MTESNTVLSFEVSQADLKTLRDSERAMKRQLGALGNIYLEALKETLSGLSAELSLVDEQILKSLTHAPKGLSIQSWQELLDVYLELKEKGDGQTDEARRELVVEIRQQVQSSIERILEQATELDSAFASLKRVRLRGADPFIAEMNAEIGEMRQVLAQLQAPIDGWLEKEKEVSALIEAIDGINLADKLRPLVESLDKLLEIDPKDPLVGSIKAGLAGLKNMLDIADEAIEYKHLTGLRKRLQTQLDDARGKADAQQRTIDGELVKLDQLTAFQALGALRENYLQQAETILQTLKSFVGLKVWTTDDELMEKLPGLIVDATTLSRYLTDLRREWGDHAALIMDEEAD